VESRDLGVDETVESQIIPQLDNNCIVYQLFYEEEIEDSTKGVRGSRRKLLDFVLPIRCKNGEGIECLIGIGN